MPGRRMPLRTVTAGLVALAGAFWPNSEPSIIVRTGAHITGRHILCGPSEIEASLCQGAVFGGGSGALKRTLLTGRVEGRSVGCRVRE